MCRTSFENFIRFGGTKTFVLNLASSPVLELTQDGPSKQDVVRQWLDEVWSQTFGATAQAILKTKPFVFSWAGLSDLDVGSLRDDALLVWRGYTRHFQAGRAQLARLVGLSNYKKIPFRRL